MAKSFVVGFMFSPDKKQVVLIKKKRPDWQLDKWNGVGGMKEKEDFNSHAAMVREFKEETGVETNCDDWKILINLMNENDEKITFFKCFSKDYNKVKNLTDEEIRVIFVSSVLLAQLDKMRGDKVKTIDLLNNIAWLILLALDNDISKLEGYTKNPK